MSAQITDDRIKGIEAALALALARSAASFNGGGAGGFFVWQPGGTPGVGIYTTPQSLGAALAKVKGVKIVGVDTTNGSAHLTLAGSPYNLSDVEFVPVLGTPGAVITVDAGVTFTPSTTNLSFRGCLLQTTGGGTAVWSPTADASLRLSTSDLLCSAGAPLMDCASGIVTVIGEDGSIIGDGTNSVFVVEAAGNVTMLAVVGSDFRNNIISQGTAPGGVATVDVDSSSAIGPSQGAGVTLTTTLIGLNAVEAFLAANSGAVASVTVPTGDLTMERTGRVEVSGFIGGSNSGAATVTVQLLRDAGVIATYPPIVLGAAGNWAAQLAITDTLADSNVHTYSIKATPSAGTISVVGNASKTLSNAFVQAQEQ